QAVTPVVIQTNSEGGLETVYGVDPVSFQAVGGPLVFLKGGLFKEPNDIVVDDIWAESKSAEVGQVVHLLGQDYRVAGIVEHGRGARVYMSLPVMQDAMGATGKASIFFIKTNTDPETVRARLAAKLPEYKITMARELMSLMSSDKI